MFRFQKKVSGVGGQTLKNQRSQRVKQVKFLPSLSKKFLKNFLNYASYALFTSFLFQVDCKSCSEYGFELRDETSDDW